MFPKTPFTLRGKGSGILPIKPIGELTIVVMSQKRPKTINCFGP